MQQDPGKAGTQCVFPEALLPALTFSLLKFLFWLLSGIAQSNIPCIPWSRARSSDHLPPGWRDILGAFYCLIQTDLDM